MDVTVPGQVSRTKAVPGKVVRGQCIGAKPRPGVRPLRCYVISGERARPAAGTAAQGPRPAPSRVGPQ